MKCIAFTIALTTLAVVLASCGKSGDAGGSEKKSIKVAGSSATIQFGMALAGKFEEKTGVGVSVIDGGIGAGINELKEGLIDVSISGRLMRADEKEGVTARRGKAASEFAIGYDVLGICVNPANPIGEISIEQLREIYKADGSITKWEQLGTGGLTGAIELFGRDNKSDVYEFFETTVLGKDNKGNDNRFRATVAVESSSRVIADNVAGRKGSIAYDGVVFNDPQKVKWLAISRKTGGPAVLPEIDEIHADNYPLARYLYLHTVGEPSGVIKEFVDFVLSPDGQALLTAAGYVSIN